ncbi:hypothetical protein OHV05_34595 [Kitasatospora sp. NBC_00070]|uniref:hypothetical protein n=1 Tax=Kitasatospora sp. NBC_00070 TaxID=2975962 RepID=UPI0032490283
MSTPIGVVFVFDQEEDAMVFTSMTDAACWMEAVDVEAGEYTAAFTVDGHIITMTGRGEVVVLVRTDQENHADLERRLARHWHLNGLGQTPSTPAEAARLLFDRQNEPRPTVLRRITTWWRKNRIG